MAPLRQAQAPAPEVAGAPGHHLVEDLWRDLRYAVRSLRRQPLFTLAAMITLALGIGANTAIFSVVNAVLLQPLPYPEASRLFVVHEQRPAPVLRTRLSAENFLDLRTRSFESLAGYIGTGFTLAGSGEPEFVLGQSVSAELFSALRVSPLIGRAFSPEENEGGRDQVMILSHALWQRRYGGDPRVVGQRVLANGKPYTVIGVMPAGFDFPHWRYELWVPFAFRHNAQGMVNRSSRFLQVVGRLREGVTAEQAQAELTTIARGLASAYPDQNSNLDIRLVSLTDETVGAVRTALLLILAAAGFVLLTACANVTNLLLARATTRGREIAVRITLGANRARLLRQLVTETLLLYAAGAIAGLAVAVAGLRALTGLGPADLPRLEQTSFDLVTLAFTIGVTLAAGLVFGVVPALHATRRGPAASLRAEGRSLTSSRATRRVRAALVATEVALALMLAVGASLAGRTLLQLERVDIGLDAEGVLTFNVVPPETAYPDGPRVRAFHRDLMAQLSELPGAVAIGATTHLPLSGQDVENSVGPEGWQRPSPDQSATAGLRGVAGRFIEALRARLTEGRTITDSDTASGQLVAMVNTEFARRYWPGQRAVGKRLKLGGLEADDEPWRVVVGTYGDIKHRGPESAVRPEVLLPYAQLDDAWVTRWMRGISVVIRTRSDPTGLVAAARGAVRAVDPSVPLIAPQRLTTLASESVAQPRFRSALLLAFAGLAVLLAFVGIFGVVGFNVAQRTQEIGLRLALGAQRASVVRLILRQEAVPVCLGMVIGLLGSILVGRAMRGLLFEVAPTDAMTFIGTPVVLAAVVFVACLLPARRALGVEPATVLRAE